MNRAPVPAGEDASMVGNRIAFVGLKDGDKSSPNVWQGQGYRMESPNLGSTWSPTTSHPNAGDGRQVTFTIKPSNAAPTLAEAWTDRGPGASFKAKYHRKV